MRIQSGAIVAAVLFTLVVAFLSNKPDVDESAATLAAAVIGVTGTSLGHARGHRHAAAGPGASCRTAVAVLVGLLVSVVVAGYLLYRAVPESSPIAPDAAGALTAATVGVIGTVIAQERWLRSAETGRSGAAIFLVVLAMSMVLLVWEMPGTEIQGRTWFAAAVIGVVGTFIGHSAGRRHSR